MAAKTKSCTKCDVRKPIGQFGVDNRAYGDGLTYWCKACSSKNHKDYRTAKPERARERDRHYRLENPSTIKAIKERYYAKKRAATKERKLARLHKKLEAVKAEIRSFKELAT